MTFLTDSGSSHDQKCGMLLSILFPSTVHVDGIVIDVNDLHPEKALLPTTDTDDEIVIDVNELQSQKAY